MTNPADIRISVKTRYLPEQSDIAEERYVFAYTITIRNDSGEPCQLLSRRWVITDANGEVQEVAGKGVVGEQPQLAPGQEYTYTSGSLLKTPTGTMQGTYTMCTDTGDEFDATIPTFALVPPHLLH
ncbi:Co2+/Mg2+ efflux protein ApaG [Pseudomaricurvus sp. HS19]|uniref:Co2+/Mg2+ efflux protein ApaG n=1 Tax=Pseudomaricurvus sp. HS19 TaxID=2692626 RepID=UPI00136D437E|nr:Co2+/Mg2+ efflux protein ApaG [Pseudomaricurvus sp. HS19]MYM64335.1 Co2+/Mg2+ efflux protein ApaG [Pseudomaricurvus sp. HS19]